MAGPVLAVIRICPLADIRNCPETANRSQDVIGRWISSAPYPPLCALILVECLVTEDAPNGLICMG